VIALALNLVFLAGVAIVVPWTAAAVAAWLVSAAVLAAALLVHPNLLRFGVDAPVVVAWSLVIFFPTHSPFPPLSAAERAFHEAIHRVSAGARSGYHANTLTAQREALVAELKVLDPPDERWRLVQRAQLLDLSADPPQVGVGDATHRLVTWPWRVALDQRIVPVRLRLDDAIRARRLRRHPLPGFDEMTTVLRYDHYFLRNLTARFADLRQRDGGLHRWRDEAAALLSLGGAVPPPTASCERLRDLVLEIHGLELKAAIADLSAEELDRLAIAADQAQAAWVELEAREANWRAAR